MMRAILTGATGFVGANLARRLVRDGHEVHLLLRPGYRPWRIEGIRAQVALHEVDLGDPAATASIVRAIAPQWVFHLAAYGAYSDQTDLPRIVQTNFVQTIHLVEAVRATGFAAFVHAGSSSEYGFKDHAPAENEWLEPNSHYAVTKAAATLYCRHTAQARRVPLRVLRLYSVYGPWEEPTRLMPTLIAQGLQGRLPPLVNPTVSRDYVYVDDVVDAFLLAATAPGQEAGAVYNIGTGTQTTLAEVVGLARRVLSIAPEPRWGSMPDRQWDTSVWRADPRRAAAALGWRPRWTLEQGFRQTVQWLTEHPELHERYGLSERH